LTASSAKYKAGFGPMLPAVAHAPYADSFDLSRDLDDPDALDYIERVLFQRLVPADEVAAVVVEPVLGEGGYVVPPVRWMQRLRTLCDEYGILLVADEIQSGMGRTGKMWAVEHFDVMPDIVLTGKGIASGMPLGAMIARSEVMTWTSGAHGSTYGGNPVSCAAALATIDLVEKELTLNAQEIGRQLLDELRALREKQPLIRDVRGMGLMVGVEFDGAAVADAVQDACLTRGLLVLRAGDATIRMSPPLIINRDQAATGVRLFEDACAHVAG
jgi:4-aminobutyrate aminotransferase